MSATPQPARVLGLSTRTCVALLLALHAAFVIPGIFRNSITFDENFHLPAGALYLARGYTHVSIGQPPLARALYALPAIVQAPRLPPDSILVINAERAAGQSFEKLNAGRLQWLYLPSRFVALLMSLAVGLATFALGREIYGPRAGLLALAAWAAMPEAVAQAGLIGMDLPTTLAFLLVMLAFRRLVLRGGGRDITLLTLASGAALLTRYSVLQLVPVLVALAAWAVVGRQARRPAWLAWGLVVACVGGLALLDLGYLGQVTMLPMGQRGLESQGMKAIAHSLPWLRLPLPDAYIAGFDYLRFITESFKPIYVFGTGRTGSVWWYFPLAAAIKWPLGWIALLLVRLGFALKRPRRPSWDEGMVLLPALMVIGVAMSSDLGYGLRYLLPAMPFLCVWVGGLLAPASPAAMAAVPPRSTAARGAAAREAQDHGRAPRGWAVAAVLLIAAQAAECALATPWQLSHFNAFAGGRGDRIVNDSSVDWGQGLIALREEMKQRGIRKILLTYHGTTDPAIYGIDYVPYLGGPLDPSAEWLAVSSYYFVGLSQRMVTPAGDTPFLTVDFRPFWSYEPTARPGNCMYLFRLRR